MSNVPKVCPNCGNKGSFRGDGPQIKRHGWYHYTCERRWHAEYGWSYAGRFCDALADAKRLREIWLTPGQDERPGQHIIRTLQVAAPFLKADRGEIGYAAANIIERLAKQAEEALTAREGGIA